MPRHNSFSTRASSSSQPEEAAAAAAASGEYFVQQAKLYRHLEKRFNRFNKKAENESHRPNRNRQFSKPIRSTHSTPSNASTSLLPVSSSTSSDTLTGKMISSNIRVPGKLLAQVAVSVMWFFICTGIDPHVAPCCRFRFVLDHRYCQSACSKQAKQEEGR